MSWQETFIAAVKAQTAAIEANTTAVESQTDAIEQTSNAIADVEWTVAAGASDVCIFTGQLKDANGDDLAAVAVLPVYIAEAADGEGLSADNFSTGAAVTDGVSLGALTANKAWMVQFGEDGKAAISITDTNNPADQRAVAVLPSGAISVSDPSGANWGA